ncbi:MAG: hypothetical protein AAFX87_14095 [Bacteroidota bacterium]
MKRLTRYTLFFFLLISISCSNLNKVRTDGGRNFNGEVFNILYVETELTEEILVNRIKNVFGKPTSYTNGLVKYDLDAQNPLSNEPLSMIIHLDSILHTSQNELVFDYLSMDVIVHDQNQNDLLTDEKLRQKGKKVFQQLIDN